MEVSKEFMELIDKCLDEANEAVKKGVEALLQGNKKRVMECLMTIGEKVNMEVHPTAILIGSIVIVRGAFEKQHGTFHGVVTGYDKFDDTYSVRLHAGPNKFSEMLLNATSENLEVVKEDG